jgi:tetratricopeptide (TPR) repeat protein/tRNA A-37 threonylcarbamoyl transferase component Bud32
VDAPSGLSRFLRGRMVGRGASAEVYQGRDRVTSEQVAIKRLHAHLTESIVAERFEREARLLASIQSPYLVRYVTHGVDDEERLCLVLEWLEGEDLAQRQRTRPLSRTQVFAAMREAALALEVLHGAGIVHRDVKPSNFFVSDQPQGGVLVKLLDLGVARADLDETMTAHGLAIGTPAYMSPEQARGDDRVGPPADIFSMGVMLFELLCGRKPYTGEDMYAVLAKVVLQEPPRLSHSLPGIPPEIDHVVSRAMAKRPEDRFASARDLADALALLPGSDELTGAIGDDTSTAPSTSGLSGGLEQRVVTAVFAQFDADADSAAVRFEEVARRNGAAVHGVLGQRRVAIFGAVGSRGDEAARGARTALALTAPDTRLAVVTAQAVASGRGMLGKAIERGTREVEKSRGEVRIDEPTARLVRAQFAIDGERGERVLRGERALPSFAGPRLLGQMTPMVGRDRELGALVATFEQCVAEPIARAVLLLAAPGAGKSRLRYEFLTRVTSSDQPVTVLLGRGDSLSAGSPFGMIGQALRRLAGILDGEPLEQSRRKLLQLLAARFAGADLVRITELLGELMSVPFPDEQSPMLRAARESPVLMGDAIRAAWEEWIAAETAVQPLLIVLEDLHWGDLPSIHLCDMALRLLMDHPLMVLAVARPEIHDRFPTLWHNRQVEQMRLAPLTPRACRKLMRFVLGPAVDERSLQLVVERAEGNAFFLEELIRALAEGPTSELPETVLGMVQARLDALGAEAKRVLRAASVFGATFWRGGASALLGADPGDVLARLAERETIMVRAVATIPGEQEFVFRHALVRDAAYAMLTDADRVVAHRMAGEWLAERRYPDAIVLAEHFARGGEPARAVRWYRRAAEQALEGNDLVAAIERAERGAACGADGEILGALRAIQGEAHRWRGELAAAEKRGMEAITRLPHASAAWLRAVGELGAAAGLLGHIDRVVQLAQQAAAATPKPSLLSVHLTCLCRLVIPIFWGGRHQEAAPLFARIDAFAGDMSAVDALARAGVHFTRATRAQHAGDPATHLVEQENAAAAFAEGGDRRGVCTRHVAVGFAYAELGQYQRAEEVLQQALAHAQRLGLHNIEARARNNLGNVLKRLGRLDAARAVESQAIEACAKQGDPRLEAASRVYLSQILLSLRDPAGALQEADRAIALSSSAPGTHAVALAARADAVLAQGRPMEARQAAIEAMSVLQSIGQLDEGESYLRLVHVRALEAAGAPAEALAAIREARDRVLQRAARIENLEWRDSYLQISENGEILRRATAPVGRAPLDE